MKTTIETLEKKYPKIQSVMRFVNEESLRGSYEKQPDSDVKQRYGECLDANIRELLRRMRAFSYFPQSQDWFRVANMGGDGEKYILRSFEDRMLQRLFGEILKAIFEPKICRTMAELKKKNSTAGSCHRFIIAVAVIEIDVVQFLKQIDQDYFVEFLRQSVADKNFVRYYERFLRSGAKLLAGCTDSESESVVCFLSMMLSICEYYILQLMSSKMKRNFRGLMWVLHDDKSVKFMFEKGMDCKQAYHQLCHEMRKIGIDPIKDKICIFRVLSDRNTQFSSAIPHRRISGKAENRSDKLALSKKQIMILRKEGNEHETIYRPPKNHSLMCRL